MDYKCEICNEHDGLLLCDHAKGTGIVTSSTFQQITVTCDRRMCTKCATKLWAGCDVCPEHASEVYKRLDKMAQIYKLFLDNHELSDKFEDFLNRIIRKKLGIK